MKLFFALICSMLIFVGLGEEKKVLSDSVVFVTLKPGQAVLICNQMVRKKREDVTQYIPYVKPVMPLYCWVNNSDQELFLGTPPSTLLAETIKFILFRKDDLGEFVLLDTYSVTTVETKNTEFVRAPLEHKDLRVNKEDLDYITIRKVASNSDKYSVTNTLLTIGGLESLEKSIILPEITNFSFEMTATFTNENLK